MKKMTKIAGWSKEWAKRFGEMTEEQEEEVMDRICRKLKAEGRWSRASDRRA